MPTTTEFGITDSGAGLLPQPMKQLDPGASPQEWFGSEVRRHRLEQKLSARALGRLVQVSDDMILAVEKGQYPSCRPELAERLDTVLETGGLLARAWPMVFGRRDADKSRPDADKPARVANSGHGNVLTGRILDREQPSLSPGSRESVDRRAFLHVSGLAVVASADLTEIFAPAGLSLPPAIRPSHIAQVREVAATVSRLDNGHGGGGMVSDLGARAMQWAAGLLQADCPDALRPAMFAAIAHLGIVVGTSAFDAYAHHDAVRSLKFAADCAEEASDWHLRAKAYSMLARQAVWTGALDDGLTYAEKGLVRSDRLTATEQAMLHTARARACGKLGDVRTTLMAVGQADDAFAHACPEADPPWMAYYDEAQHNGDTAHALFDLAIRAGHDPGRAVHRFTIAVEGHREAYRRSRAISRTKLASLLMAKGDPAEATAIGNTALDEVGRLTSQRAADDLRELGRFAARHPRNSDIRALRERIAATVQT